MATDINEFAKQVEADLVAVNPEWAEHPFGTEQGILEQYEQTFDGVGTIFYYAPATNPTTGELYRNTLLLEAARDDAFDPGDGIDDIEPPTPPEASDLVFYGCDPPETPALSPIWFDTETGDIRIWYSYNGNETWINTGVAGVGKIEFLNDLQDVDTLSTAPADKHALFFDAGHNHWLNRPAVTTDISDIEITGLDDNHILKYDLASTKWKNLDHVLNELNDVTINTPLTGQVLQYINGQWQNSGGNIIVWYDNTPPLDTALYPFWFNTDLGDFSVFYDDGDSQQWIAMNASYANELLNTHAFHAGVVSNYTWGTGTEVLRAVTTVAQGFDEGNNYDNGLYRYTAPVDGLYEFAGYTRTDSVSHTTYTYLKLRKNGTDIINTIEGNNESTNYMGQYLPSLKLKLVAGDYMDMAQYENADTSHTTNSQSWWSGQLIRRDV